jgi:hypothetical protein
VSHLLKKVIKAFEEKIEKQGIKSSMDDKLKPFVGTPKAPKK